ncbi:MAG: dimethylarginine dimethylaminohydrolase [Microcella sp.]|uniref:dimethylargininase n=1 Tax=Microcella sp. TaxID=1913979 RepID=UPI0024CD6860|nr:dimethylargininase [Microcella sp.]UYN83373.1 MAG: dimethylarginine dimethylaminohydrolase [Microcella sp.]
MTPLARRLLDSALAAFAVALVTHLVTIVLYSAINGATLDVLVQLNGIFGFSSLLLFVFLTIVGTAPIFEHPLLTALVGVLAAFVASWLGALLALVASGNAISGELIDYLWVSVFGFNLLFQVVAVLSLVTVGRRVITMRAASRPARRIAIVRMPSARLAEGEVTHLEHVPVDADLADQQWEAYVETLRAEGFTIVDVPPADELPDSVFVEDVLVVIGSTAVVTRPGADSRKPEVDAAEQTARELGLRIERIVAPGTLDGGDVLQIADTIYVGRGGRTNAEGIRQLREIAGRLGREVVAVPVSRVLHLKSAVTALPDGTVVGHPSTVDDVSMWRSFLPMPEPEGGHVVVLGDDRVLMAASAPESAELIRSLGYRVVTVDISEFEKLEGCVTCLSVLVR